MPPVQDCSNNSGYVHVVKEYAAITGTTLFVLLIVPNSVVIALIIRNLVKSRRLNVPRIFVLGLAFTDFGYGALNVSLQIVNYWLGYCASGGKPGCVMRGFMSNFLSVASLLLVVSMSFERFVALKLPFKYDRVFTVTRTAILVTGVIVYSCLIASLPLFGINRYGFRGFCDFYWPDSTSAGSAYTYFRAIQGLVTMPVLLGFNTVVIGEVWQMRRRVQPEMTTEEATGSQSDKSRQLRVVVLVVLISLVYIICNTPYCARLIEHQRGVQITAQQDIHIKRLYLCQSIVNPLLYLLFNLSGARWLHRMLKKRSRGGATTTSAIVPVTVAPYSLSATI